MEPEEIIKLILKLKREKDDIIEEMNDLGYATVKRIKRIKEINIELSKINKMENNPFNRK
ncbi:hypothetical protein [Bacillus xiapuensis]|uniref:Uncharacterized protein n=1 Tax=Bacillus xiapuensis TaxID=2014075 RepID=A0ABU6N7V6_9BACI|nr:hypothetical protein [Bacillus xiapuensis]